MPEKPTHFADAPHEVWLGNRIVIRVHKTDAGWIAKIKWGKFSATTGPWPDREEATKKLRLAVRIVALRMNS